MKRVVRTRSARADVAAIAWHIAEDNLHAAEGWLDEIDETLNLIAAFPEIGERVDHLTPGLRRHCVGQYLLFYFPLDDGIELRRVLHGARRIEDEFPLRDEPQS
jgi:toxin ParE1/3/4